MRVFCFYSETRENDGKPRVTQSLDNFLDPRSEMIHQKCCLCLLLLSATPGMLIRENNVHIEPMRWADVVETTINTVT